MFFLFFVDSFDPFFGFQIISQAKQTTFLFRAFHLSSSTIINHFHIQKVCNHQLPTTTRSLVLLNSAGAVLPGLGRVPHRNMAKKTCGLLQGGPRNDRYKWNDMFSFWKWPNMSGQLGLFQPCMWSYNPQLQLIRAKLVPASSFVDFWCILFPKELPPRREGHSSQFGGGVFSESQGKGERIKESRHKIISLAAT